jgi:hypothetical protein
MKMLLYIFLISISFGMGNCQKSKPVTTDTCETVRTAPADFLEYFYFKKDSWWVYKLAGSSPAVYDTVKVFFQKESFKTPSQPLFGESPCNMIYQCNLVHSNRQYFQVSTPNVNGGIDFYTAAFKGNIWLLEGFTETGKPQFEQFFGYPFFIGMPLSVGTLIDTNPVTTPLQTFNNCVQLGQTSQPDGRRIFMSRGVGFVKIKWNATETWELVNYRLM